MSGLTDVHCPVSVFFLVVLAPFVVFLVQVWRLQSELFHISQCFCNTCITSPSIDLSLHCDLFFCLFSFCCFLVHCTGFFWSYKMFSPLLQTLLSALCLCSFITHHQEPAAALSLAIIMGGGGGDNEVWIYELGLQHLEEHFAIRVAASWMGGTWIW